MKKSLTAIIIIVTFASCNNFYKAVTTNGPANNLETLNNNNRYFILRHGDSAFAMKKVDVSPDKKSIHCLLEQLPYDHTTHIDHNNKSKLTYRRTGESIETNVLNEVHLYVSPDSNIKIGWYTFALDKINKTEVIETDAAKTKHSKNMGIIIGSASIVAVGAVVAAIVISNMSIF